MPADCDLEARASVLVATVGSGIISPKRVPQRSVPRAQHSSGPSSRHPITVSAVSCGPPPAADAESARSLWPLLPWILPPDIHSISLLPPRVCVCACVRARKCVCVCVCVCRPHAVAVSDKSVAALALVLSCSAAILLLRFRCTRYWGCSTGSSARPVLGNSPHTCRNGVAGCCTKDVALVHMRTPCKTPQGVTSMNALAGAHLVRASTLSIWRAHRAPVLWGDLGSSLVGLGRSAHHQADAIEDARFRRHVERGDADHANCSATDEGVRGPQPRATRRLWTEGTRARRRMASGASSARAAWWRHAAVMGLRVLRAGGWMAPWRVMGSSGGWWRRPSFQPRTDASSQAQAHRAPSWTLQRRAARLWFVHPEPQRW